MTPLSKFLRRVRIHGGDSGAVARALHHMAYTKGLTSHRRASRSLISDENAFSYAPADFERFSKSTIERKQMSTKTTLKRIALVAVSALGFGVLASVAPASAAPVAATGVSAATPGPFRVGQHTTIRFSITHAGVIPAADNMRVTATLTAKPDLSTATVLDLNNGATSAVTLARLVNTVGNGAFAVDPAATATVATGEIQVAAATTTTSYVDVVLTPDVAGSYQVLLSTGNATYVAGDKNAVVTVTTAGAPATATISSIGSTIATGGTTGSILKVTLKDAAGNATKLAANESIDLSVTTGAALFVTSGTATQSLGINDFATGTAYTNIKNATASNASVVTLTGGGVLGSSATLTTTFPISSSVASGTAAGGAAVWQQGTGAATTGFVLAASTLKVSSTATSQSIGVNTLTANGTAGEATATATKYFTVTVTDTTGAITGKEGASYEAVLSQAGGGATISSALSVTATLGAPPATGGGTSHTYTVAAQTITITAGPLTVSGERAVSTTTGAISPAVVNAATGATLTFTSKIVDQFGVAFPGAAVTATVTAGRNLGKTANMVADALGYVSYTLTDTGTTGLSDTISFIGNTTVTATVSYGLATVSTATITGGNTTAGVTSVTKTERDINAGDGAELTTYDFTVTVKDANAALLAGLPVAWTVSGTGLAVTSTTANGFTGAAGTHTAQVYGWIAGTYTVTATVGGKTATAEITFAQTAAGEERAISATVSGPIVTAKVVDRFGNPVPGVTVYATKTGVGFFVSGVTKTSSSTAADGTVEFVVAGGSADVTVSTINYASPAGSFGSGQTSAPKGYLGNSTTAAGLALLAITAYTAGTSTLAEEGVGASFDAAGVPSATVSVVADTSAIDAANEASDAAAEAIDAANAATDAANLAAEAADAATVAAEEARDAADAATAAVEELATQVATLMAALKAQITTLANTVAKIAKKVKA